MIKFLKILIPLISVGLLGLFTYNKLITKVEIKDWVGEYKSIKPNIVKRKFLFTNHDINAAYFSAPGSRKIVLNSNFTFTSLQVGGNDDTIHYSGQWEFKNEKPLLHFPSKECYLNQLPLSEKIYFHEKVKTCGGDTINHFAVFKNIN